MPGGERPGPTDTDTSRTAPPGAERPGPPDADADRSRPPGGIRARLARADPVTLGLAAAAFAIALAQRPGRMTADTKVDLHVDPVGFLADVATVWTPTGALGHVQGGQYGGYLFPMGPFFALGHEAGLAPWLVHRLWLGAVLALAAWGTVRLLDALLGPDRRPARLAAGAVVLLNPYVATFTGRTSVTLLAYAALPWLLLAVHRGLRAPRGWWWPAAFALLVGASGGGVNAAVIAWTLAGPAALLVYEAGMIGVAWRDARAFALRAAACLAFASLWWVAPVAVQALYGVDFLRFTEQPGTIWSTTGASEALRLMGYWVSYVGVGYTGELRPYLAGSSSLLFHPAVVVASLLVPALAVAGFLWTRRWAYGPFFLALVLGGVLVVLASFPEGTPLRRALYLVYNRVEAVQFLRTTYKAAPLIALGVAMLAGAGAAAAWTRARRARPALAAGAVALIVAASWPLATGRALDPQLTVDEIPPAWRSAAAGLDAELPRNTRAVVLPGELFSYYRWGGTYDPILPALTDRPVAIRSTVPYADLHATDLLWTTDALVQQERLLPGQLGPLLRLLGAGALVVPADGDRARSAGLGAADAVRVMGLGVPDRAYGRRLLVRPAAGGLEPAVRLPEVARYDVGSAGIVRVRPTGAPTIVDGSADGVAGLAAVGGLDPARALEYAGDRGSAELRRTAEAGAELVISDSNRRQAFAAARLRQNRGATLAADEPLSEDAAVLDPFERGSEAQTVAQLRGVAAVRAPVSPQTTQYPERRPFAALDGDPATVWLGDPALERARHWMEVELPAPRDVPHVDLLPAADRAGRVTSVKIAGRRHPVRPGWNRLRLGLRGVRTLRATIAGVATARGHDDAPGGIAELRVPGVRARERLRPPRLLERALRGADLRRSALSYVLQRTTGDDPFHRSPVAGAPQARDARDRGDPETQLARVLEPPVARAFRADGWVSIAARAPDSALDRLAGTAAAARFDSSGRYQGLPKLRASRAFDGDARTAWIGAWVPGRRAWLQWTAPRPVTLRGLTLRAPRARVRRPTRVVLRWPGGAASSSVARSGAVRLPAPVRARRFRLEIAAARFPPGTSGRDRQRRAVGIAEVVGSETATVLPRGRYVTPKQHGTPKASPAGAGPLRARCGALRVLAAGQLLRLRPEGTTADLDAGRPLRARACGPPARLPARRIELTTASATFLPHLLRLRSPAPAGTPRPTGGGRVVDPGRERRAARDGVRLDLAGPSWLVLAESFNRGWHAWCDGRELGPPRVVDGFANGWRAPAGCRTARFAFGPDRVVKWAYAIGGLASLLLALLLIVRRPPRPRPAATAPLSLAGRAPPKPWPTAIAIGLAAGALLGFLLALRAGVVIAPAVALIVRYGIGARPLLLGAAALLGVALPALYLLARPEDHGGFNPAYAVDIIAAHWVAVAGLTLAGAALVRTLSTAMARRAAAPRSRP